MSNTLSKYKTTNNSKENNSEKEIIKFIDICSGIGGFRVAINEYAKTNSKYKLM